MGRWRTAALVAATAIVAACAPQETRPPAPAGAPVVPTGVQARYDAIARSGKPVFVVDVARSSVILEVRRAGALANLGHDHIVASHDVRGFVAPSEGSADLAIAVATLDVDEPALRSAAGFDTQPSEADVAGTRHNLTTRVLHADEHPLVLVRLTGVRADAGAQMLHPTLTVNGVEGVSDAPANIAVGADEIRVNGETVILQTVFGIRPFSILGGALEVADAVTIRFAIVARRPPA